MLFAEPEYIQGPMNELDRMLATMRSAWRALARNGASWHDEDGIGALVTPSVPERSVLNCVIYERGADVAGAYEGLAPLFDGVDAWTVWVPQEDTETAGFLERQGHELDAEPAGMVLELATFEQPAPPPNVTTPSVDLLGDVNESAYPWQDGSMRRGIVGGISPEDYRLYATENSSVLGIRDCDGDAGLFFVATLPEARGRGLSYSLIGQAMTEARDRGCDISTLQGTRMGEPVYERLGYRTITRIQMWEKRQ